MGRSSVFASGYRRSSNQLSKGWGYRSVITLLLATVVSIFSTGPVQGRTLNGEYPPYFQESLSKEAIISLTNNARATEGLSRLDENELLDTVAEARAKDILDKQYFGHVSPSGERASHIAQKVGYRYSIIAENLVSGVFFRNSKIVDCWMDSPSHRKNILSAQVREIGVSVIRGRLNGAEVCVSVQIFGLRQTSPSGIFFQYPSRWLRPSNSSLLLESNNGDPERVLRRVQREIDAREDVISGDLRVPSNDPRRNEDLNLTLWAQRRQGEIADRIGGGETFLLFAKSIVDR